jgi:predicted Zn-dependent protease
MSCVPTRRPRRRHQRPALLPWLLALVLAATVVIGRPRPATAGEGAEGSDSAPEAPPPASPKKKDKGEEILSTPYNDEDVGREEAKKAEAEVGIYHDLALTAYVEAIGNRLAEHAPGFKFNYTFRISDQDEPNAFALPGGWIFISRGVLALSVSEDEVANVIAHEITHVAARHAAAKQAVAGPGFIQVLEMPYLAAYSRDLERTADRGGQDLAAASGYDPDGMRTFLEDLSALERLRLGAPHEPSFLDTHPGSDSRAAEAGQRAQLLQWHRRAGFSKDRNEHLRRLEGLVVGENAAEGVFLGSRFVHPDLGFTLRFPDGWQTRNTAAAVGAISPDERARVVLEHDSTGTDPFMAAQHWARAHRAEGVRVWSGEPVKVSGIDCYRVVAGAGGGLHLNVTFIPWRGEIYRITGVTAAIKSFDGIFRNVARSFRPITPDLAAEVFQKRIHIVEAKQGETLAELSQRTGNAWPLQKTAIMNELRPDQTLEAGKLVKIAISRPYKPPAPGPSPDGSGSPQAASGQNR